MKEDIELFLETEKSYNFFDLEIENVLIWKYIRSEERRVGKECL